MKPSPAKQVSQTTGPVRIVRVSAGAVESGKTYHRRIGTVNKPFDRSQVCDRPLRGRRA